MADTHHESIAATYAKALLATTEKSGGTADVLGDLESLVSDVFAGQSRFTDALSSPRLAVEEKLGLIDRTLGGRISPTLLNFLKVIAQHDRFGALATIAKSYRHQVNDMSGRAEVTVTTAQPLDADLRERVIQTLEARLGKQIDLRSEVDESLIGGIVVRVGDAVFDASVLNRLDRMRQTAIKNTASRLQKA
jgi:F-type H+-transporting ATPase subunit delta